jgi:hypothetical protein
MSDAETQENQEAPAPAPVGPPRVPGLDVEVAMGLHGELDREVERYVGEFDHRHAGAYASRGHMRYALGFSPEDVLDDFWMAARCLAGDAALFLARHPPEQLLTRRILPVEYGVLGGHLEIARRLAASYALPTLAIHAGVGGAELKAEGRIISPGLLGKAVEHPQHLLGLAAAVYAGALGSAVRGYGDEVQMTLRLLAQVQFRGELSEAHKQLMVRYTGLCEVLLELVQPEGRDLPAILADQIERYTARLAQGAGESFYKPSKPLRYVDTSSLALMGLMAMLDHSLSSFPPHPEVTPSAVPYLDFVQAMTQAERHVEPPQDMALPEGLASLVEQGQAPGQEGDL